MSNAAWKTAGVCLLIEIAVFLLFLMGTKMPLAALYYTVVIGPLSLFLAPSLYRHFGRAGVK